MQDFNDLLNGITDGTKDLSINALTCAGTATLNGHVNLGNSSADDLTITASLASTLAIKTNNSFDIGSSTLGLRKIYLGNGGAGATCDIIAAAHTTTREYTIPDCGAAAVFVMTQATQTVAGTTTFSGQLIGKGTATNDSPSAGYIGETISASRSTATTAATTNVFKALTEVALTAGDWNVAATGTLLKNGATLSAASFEVLVSSSSGAVGAAVSGKDYVLAEPPATGTQQSVAIVPYRVSISTLTTHYLNVNVQYSAGTPTWRGFIQGTRIR